MTWPISASGSVMLVSTRSTMGHADRRRGSLTGTGEVKREFFRSLPDGPYGRLTGGVTISTANVRARLAMLPECLECWLGLRRMVHVRLSVRSGIDRGTGR